VDLSSCTILTYLNGSSSPAATVAKFPAGATLAAGGLYAICSSYAGTLKSHCQRLDAGIVFDGNDAMALSCGGMTLDVIGQIGDDPGASGWGAGSTTTAKHTLIRKCSVVHGRTDGGASFDPGVEWDGYPVDTFDHLGSRSCP
jgi:hypothetical protein